MDNQPAFQLLSRSAGYLTAAKICTENGGNKALLRAPILHLVANGIEVLLKHVQVVGGKALKQVRKEFGHNILMLWNDDLAKDIKAEAEKYSRIAWKNAIDSGKFEDAFNGDPVELLNEYLCELSKLHSSETDFALRYVSDANQMEPVPLLLIDTFLPVKDEYVRRFSRA